MATFNLRTEAKQIIDGLPDETLSVAVGLLTALKDQKPLQRADLLAVYPWARHFSDVGQDKFFDELTSATKQARTSGDWSKVDHVIEVWSDNAAFLSGDEAMVGVDDESDLLDTEYMEQARREVKDAISLEEVRAIWAKIPGSLSDFIIAEREDRF